MQSGHVRLRRCTSGVHHDHGKARGPSRLCRDLVAEHRDRAGRGVPGEPQAVGQHVVRPKIIGRPGESRAHSGGPKCPNVHAQQGAQKLAAAQVRGSNLPRLCTTVRSPALAKMGRKSGHGHMQMQKCCSNRNGNAVEMAMRYTSRTHLSKGLTMKWLNRTLRDRSYRWTVDTRPSHRDYIGIQAELDPRRA